MGWMGYRADGYFIVKTASQVDQFSDVMAGKVPMTHISVLSSMLC